MTEGRAAAFLDRDGTIIVDRDYPGDPRAVELIPGAAEAIARLRGSGLLVLMVTNQSGIGRGLITESDYRAVQARMERLLADAGRRWTVRITVPMPPIGPRHAIAASRRWGCTVRRPASTESTWAARSTSAIGCATCCRGWVWEAPGISCGGRNRSRTPSYPPG